MRDPRPLAPFTAAANHPGKCWACGKLYETGDQIRLIPHVWGKKHLHDTSWKKYHPTCAPDIHEAVMHV